jgi:WD40 repeat protein
VSLDRARWRTDSAPDDRLVRGWPVGSVDAVAAVEYRGRLVVATAAEGHYDGDCVWEGRHDCYESFLRVWDFMTGADIAQIPDAGGYSVCLIPIDDHLHVVVTSEWGPVRCWDAASGEGRIIAESAGFGLRLAAGYHGDRAVVACDTRDTLFVFDPLTGEIVEQFDVAPGGWPRGVWQVDESWVRAVKQRDGTVSVRRVADGALIHEVADPGWFPTEFAGVGDTLAIARPGVVDLHNLRTGAKAPMLAGHTAFASLAPIVLDGVPHLVTASDFAEVRLWNLTAPGPAGAARHADPIIVAMFVHEDLLVTADSVGTLRRWRGGDGRPIGSPVNDRIGPVRDLAAVRVGGGGTVLLTAGSAHDGDDSALRRWDPFTGERVGPVIDAGHCGESKRLAVAEVDGRMTVLSGGNDGYLTMWDPTMGERLHHEETGRYPVSGLAVGQIHGRPVAVVSRMLLDPVRFFDLTDWSQPSLTVDEEDWRYDTVRGLVTSDGGGATMVTTDGDGTLRLWSLDGDSWRVRDFEYAAARVTAVAVTYLPRPMVAVAYADRTLMLVDPATATPTAKPVRLPQAATALAFSPAGDLAVCYGIDVAVLSNVRASGMAVLEHEANGAHQASGLG